MQRSESDFKRLIENNLSRAHYFSCVILYKSAENLAWYAALSIGEIIKNYFKSTEDKQIAIAIVLDIKEIIPKLKGMEENDVLLLTTDNQIIKPLSSYLVTETLNNKRNLIFISNYENPLITPFKDITDVEIQVETLRNDKLNCVIEFCEGGKEEIKLTLPKRSLITKFKDLKASLMEESIRNQVYHSMD